MDTNNPWWVQQVKRFWLFTALVAAISIVLSYYAGYEFSLLYNSKLADVSGLWSAISACMILTTLNEDARHSTWLRIIANFMGCINAMVWVYIFGYSIWSLGISVFVSIVLCQLIRHREIYRSALIATLVVDVIGKLTHEAVWLNAVTRFAESVIGSLITMIVIHGFQPLRKRYNLYHK